MGDYVTDLDALATLKRARPVRHRRLTLDDYTDLGAVVDTDEEIDQNE